MPSYVALLRGINVGGRHKVPMLDLRATFEAFGVNDVSTYIQSGNVVFTSDAPEADLVEPLGAALLERFGFAIPVVIRSASELATAGDAHPFAHLEIDEKFLHVVFLDDAPSATVVEAFEVDRFAPDQLAIVGRDVFVAYPNGSGRSKLTADAMQRALGATATSRNWRTVQKLNEMLSVLPD